MATSNERIFIERECETNFARDGEREGRKSAIFPAKISLFF